MDLCDSKKRRGVVKWCSEDLEELPVCKALPTQNLRT
jgi:hypothetical protein